MSGTRHILLNAIANTGAGAFNVARQLVQQMGLQRPQWRFTIALIDRLPLHDEVRPENLPGNCQVFRAPSELVGLWARVRWERKNWPKLVREQSVDAVVQLNGMHMPGVDVPVLAHEQDPWPYLPEAQTTSLRWRTVAWLRRREHKRAFKHADFVGFTSHYLRDLMTRRLGCTPKRSAVFYNGVPPEWVARAQNALPGYDDRDPELISVSSVGGYKRQELVIRAMPLLVKRPGCESLRYRILGHIYGGETYKQHLLALAESLGVGGRVILEGRVPDARVEECLRRARVFVLMSICESFGIPAIEAMSFGTPVVTSNCCAMPEVCADGSAILSPVDDVQTLADNIYQVWSDRALAERMRQSAARNIVRFNWRDTAEQMLTTLEQIMPPTHVGAHVGARG